MILLPSPCNPVVDHNYFIQYNTLHDDTKGNSIGDQIPNSQTPSSSQSGEMVSQSEPWMREYNEALKLVDEISTMVSDASFLSSIGPQTQRHFASTRRKIAILRSKLETLELLMSQIPANRQPITQKETNKRKDMLASISSKVEQMANTLNPYSAARRDRLLDQDTRSDDMMKVADMDNHDVVAFQRQIIKDM